MFRAIVILALTTLVLAVTVGLVFSASCTQTKGVDLMNATGEALSVSVPAEGGRREIAVPPYSMVSLYKADELLKRDSTITVVRSGKRTEHKAVGERLKGYPGPLVFTDRGLYDPAQATYIRLAP